MGKHTQCVHSGTLKEKQHRGLSTPIYTSSSFGYLETNENVYPRYFNTPNQQAVVEKLMALEGTESGLLFSSGMAAISTVIFSMVGKGDHVVLQRDIYGGTHHFATAEFERFGISFTFVSNRPADFEKAIQKNTRLIYIETPSNPILSIIDIEAVAGIARSHQIPTAIDNTFASPINQNPHSLGIDIVIHSGTKYLGGHSDLCCGAVLSSKDFIATMKATAANLGGSVNAVTCYLLERSLKTLAVRVEKQNRNAQVLAEYLFHHDLIRKVHYPGLSAHPGHDIAKRQMSGFGGMLAFELDETCINPQLFERALILITPALSLGGVETILCAPATSSHAKISAEERTAQGIHDGLFRLSIGIEDSGDLITDLEQAFSKACQHS